MSCIVAPNQSSRVVVLSTLVLSGLSLCATRNGWTVCPPARYHFATVIISKRLRDVRRCYFVHLFVERVRRAWPGRPNVLDPNAAGALAAHHDVLIHADRDLLAAPILDVRSVQVGDDGLRHRTGKPRLPLAHEGDSDPLVQFLDANRSAVRHAHLLESNLLRDVRHGRFDRDRHLAESTLAIRQVPLPKKLPLDQELVVCPRMDATRCHASPPLPTSSRTYGSAAPHAADHPSRRVAAASATRRRI